VIGGKKQCTGCLQRDRGRRLPDNEDLTPGRAEPQNERGIVAIACHQTELINGATVQDIHGINGQRNIRCVLAWSRLSMMSLLKPIVLSELFPFVHGGETPISVNAPNSDIAHLFRFGEQNRDGSGCTVIAID